jgi:hypothetical protein
MHILIDPPIGPVFPSRVMVSTQSPAFRAGKAPAEAAGVAGGVVAAAAGLAVLADDGL